MILDISIHVLREEDDVLRRRMCPEADRFLSTSSARRTTKDGADGYAGILGISIHVLREEDDLRYSQKSAISEAISIHVLREEDDYCPAEGV